MKILLCVILLVAALLLFAVWPGKRRDELRLPFYGRNYAHRGLFGKDQCPPENSLPAFAAAAQNGYGIELDVQFTSDHRLVVFPMKEIEITSQISGVLDKINVSIGDKVRIGD